MKLEDINKKLEELSHSLDKIDYDKEIKKDDSKKVTDKVNSIDKLLAQDNFGKDELDNAVKTLGDLKTKAEEGYNKVDAVKESLDSMQGKADIKNAITSKYDSLFKQKDVIDKYIKDIEDKDENAVYNNLISIKEERIEENEEKVKSNKELKNKLKKFISKKEVKDNINKIQKLNNQNKDIEEVLKKVEQISKLEDKKAKITDKGLKDKLDKNIKEHKKELKEYLKDKKIPYLDEMAKLKAQLDKNIKDNKNEMSNAAKVIEDEINNEKDSDIKGALVNVTKDPEKVFENFKDAIDNIDTHIMKLKNNSNELRNEINLIKDDLTKERVDYLKAHTNCVKTTYEPSNDEIENDPDYKAALVPMDREDKIEAREKFLREKAGIADDDKKRHPLIWLQSRLGGRSVDKQMLAKTKEAVRTKLINAKQVLENEEYIKKADASERKDTARTKFVDELTRNVITNKGIDIDKAAVKAYKETESQKYDGR